MYGFRSVLQAFKGKRDTKKVRLGERRRRKRRGRETTGRNGRGENDAARARFPGLRHLCLQINGFGFALINSGAIDTRVMYLLLSLSFETYPPPTHPFILF